MIVAIFVFAPIGLPVVLAAGHRVLGVPVIARISFS